MFNQITCGQCALKTPDSKTCRLDNKDIVDPEASCPFGTRYLEKCDICGNEMLPSQAIIDMGLDHKTHIICPSCNSAYYTCKVCGQASICDFETNPIDLPKQVQKQMKTAQGYIVTTIPNPDRIRETCEKGCKCLSNDFGCCKQNNWCERQSIAWRNK